ncbi:hypothetical protein BVX97_05900 [bacterium E08(2017)]|nr:hypothetical protein BVX97_05900 [bacterium E08(2017)]
MFYVQVFASGQDASVEKNEPSAHCHYGVACDHAHMHAALHLSPYTDSNLLILLFSLPATDAPCGYTPRVE